MGVQQIEHFLKYLRPKRFITIKSNVAMFKHIRNLMVSPTLYVFYFFTGFSFNFNHFSKRRDSNFNEKGQYLCSLRTQTVK